MCKNNFFSVWLDTKAKKNVHLLAHHNPPLRHAVNRLDFK